MSRLRARIASASGRTELEALSARVDRLEEAVHEDAALRARAAADLAEVERALMDLTDEILEGGH